MINKISLSLFFLIGLLSNASRSFASAADIYITASGSASGICTTGVQTPAFFNNSANWGSGGSQIGAATIVHACGTFTGSAGGTMFTFQGNGTAGNVIRLRLESGSNLTAPYWSWSSGAINMNGRAYVAVDGTGTIQNTANGSSLANKVPSVGISASPCANCEIETITVANIYVHVPSENIIDQTLVNAISFSGSHWQVHDLTVHDCGWCLKNFYGNGDTDVQVHDNNIYNMDHGYSPAGSGSISASNFNFFNNHVHDYANWDCGGGCHHDGVHAYGVGGANLTNLWIYDNLFDGNPGASFTSHVYIEHPDSSTAETNPLVFNNVFVGTGQPGGNFGLLAIGAVPGAQAYNNTFVGSNNNASYCVLLSGGNPTLKNNLFTGCWASIYYYSTPPSKTYDYNTYAAVGSCGIGYSSSAVCYPTMTGWRTFTGQEANSQLVASAGLNAGFQPLTGSAAINAATNLTSLGITALNSDKNSVARTTTGAWTSGAFTTGGGGTAPNPPTGLTAVPH